MGLPSEYLAGGRVRVRFGFTHDKILKPRYVNGEQLPDWENGPEVTAFIRELLQRGYQLVSDPVDNEFTFEVEQE